MKRTCLATVGIQVDLWHKRCSLFESVAVPHPGGGMTRPDLSIVE